jgi:hypothetical protein
MSKSLNLDATLKKATFVNGKITPATNSGESESPSTDSGSSASSGTGGSGIIPTPTVPEDDQPGGGD